MTEIRVIKSEAPSIFEPPVDVLYLTQYRYDEAGNRVRKVRYKYTGSEPDPVFDVSGDAPPWTLQSDEFYVRDVSGKEIAIYTGSSLTQWNIWGLDNIGNINADTTRNYYLKDHLGSIRVVLNSTNTVVAAQDYDCWGYPLENRSYNSSAMKYDFTGKERDDETSYDYFGARYYDSRIGRWGQVDTLFNKHYEFNPYNYAITNPLKYIDPDGKQVDVNQERAKYYLNLELEHLEKTSENLAKEFGKVVEKGTEILIESLLGLGFDYAIQEGSKKAGINPNIGSGIFTIITQSLSDPLNPDVEGETKFAQEQIIKQKKINEEEYKKQLEEKKKPIKNEKISRAKSKENYTKNK